MGSRACLGCREAGVDHLLGEHDYRPGRSMIIGSTPRGRRTGNSPEGPWSGVTEPFSGNWVEGPTAVQFEDVATEATFLPGQRHGTVLRIPETLGKKLSQSLTK